MLPFADEQIAAQIADASANPNDLRARHVHEQKLGFRCVGIDVDSWPDQLGALQSSVNYEMDKDEFQARRDGC